MRVLQTDKNPGMEPRLYEFTEGTEADRSLCQQEVEVQKAWVRALLEMKGHPPILSVQEAQRVEAALNEALEQMQSGQFQWRIEDEDIHMNLERFLVEQVGEVGKKIHLGRSRNDLIATTLRLFARDSLCELQNRVSEVVLAMVDRSENWVDEIMPGMTHLQHAQPIRVSHILLAHAWALNRDSEQLSFAKKRAMAEMPLGSAALTGTTLPLDLKQLAQRLGFESPPLNSYDAVGNRDFLLDGLYGLSLLGVHLSRLAEDLIYWVSTPVSMVTLPRNWSTGSSIMPNKRNPDVPELIRGKSAHWMGGLMNGLTLLKGLPSSYNSDLHELKSVFIRNVEEAKRCLAVLTYFIRELKFNSARSQELLSQGHLLATEIANRLTQKGESFRVAYQKTAGWIECADARGQSVEQVAQAEGMGSLSVEEAVEARSQAGGTARKNILEGCELLRQLHLSSSPDPIG